MRIVSSADSVEVSEVSALAVAECFVAVSIYCALAIHSDSVIHYAAAVCAAPLFLFRTPESVEAGLDTYETFLKWCERLLHAKVFDEHHLDPGFWDRGLSSISLLAVELLVSLIYCTLLPFFAVIARISATSWHVIRHPVRAVTAMPTNWIRQSLCVDIMRRPEMVPGEEQIANAYTAPSFESLTLRLFDRKNEPAMRLAVLGILAMAYVPPILLRVSFKATCVVYAPFVWIAEITMRSNLSLKTRFERITKGELEKLRRALSILVFSCVALKIFFITNLITLTEFQSKLPVGLASSANLLIHGWPAWQLALLADAIFSYALLFAADAGIARLEVWNAAQAKRASMMLSLALFLRATLAAFIILYLSITSVGFLASTARTVISG